MTKNKKLEPGKIVRLGNDLLFKKVFGDNNSIRRLEAFISSYFDAPYKEVKGNVRVVESEKRIKNKKSKRQRVDVIAEIKLFSKEFMLNIEVNLQKGTKLFRNVIYAADILSNSLYNKQDYSKVRPVIQISFDHFDINKGNKRIVKRCFLKDETNKIISDLLEIDHIDIVQSYKAWYNGSISEHPKKDRKLILLGALLMIEDIYEFEKCLEELEMSKDIEKDIIEAVEEYSSDDEVLSYYYDEEEVRKAIYNGDISLAREEGMKDGINQSKIEIAKKMLEKNLDNEIISEVTGLSKNEIEELK